MMKFSNKDQLTTYMIAGHLHLSKKDYGFFNNIIFQIQKDKQVTTNQNKLFDKLLVKYKRQLTKLEHDVNELVSLEWKLGIIESKKEFLEARIFIQNDKIMIRSPFNTHFIQNFKRVDMNPFEWDPLYKFYKADLSTYSLKLAYSYVNKYYKDVVYCNEVKNILEELTGYHHNLYWQPTLVKQGNQFYIYGINNSLYDSISHIELNDDPKTLFALSRYGINVSSDITENDPVKHFASNLKLSYELDSLDEIIKMLKLLEVEHVFTSRDLVYNKKIRYEIQVKLLQEGITCSPQSSKNNENSILFTSNSAASFTKKISKIVHLKNSRPITIL